jgi:23S rRNA G2445 N2-methylase RlmL
MPPVTRWKKSWKVDDEDDDGDDNATLWKKILFDATNRAKIGIQRMREYQREDQSRRIRIEANDIHTGAVDIMEEALSSAGLLDFVQISNMDCYDLDVKCVDDTTYIVATNPPWGIRLTEDIEESWEGLRHFIRNKCPDGTQVFILSGDKAATAALKLKRDRMIPLQTGDQNLRWIQYTIREKKQDQQNELDSKTSQTSQTTEATAAANSASDSRRNVPQNEWI